MIYNIMTVQSCFFVLCIDICRIQSSVIHLLSCKEADAFSNLNGVRWILTL